jgi:hypothetical protein
VVVDCAGGGAVVVVPFDEPAPVEDSAAFDDSAALEDSAAFDVCGAEDWPPDDWTEDSAIELPPADEPLLATVDELGGAEDKSAPELVCAAEDESHDAD